MKYLAALVLALVLPAKVMAQGMDAAALGSVNAAIDQAVRPGFVAYSQRTAALTPKMADLCETPSSQAVGQAREAFSAALAAWSSIEFLRFGPTIVENRLERTLFWPDPKGIGLKQVQALLATEDKTAVDPNTLSEKSVAVQGLAALEFVLFGTGAEELADGGVPFRCQYGRAISENLNAIASDMADGWMSQDLPILSPGADNPAYRSANESLSEIIQALTTGFELVGEYKLRAVLGDSFEKVRPRRAVFRRSAMTQLVLASNIQGLKSLLEATDFSALLAANGSDARMMGSVEFELANAEQTIQGADVPVEQAVATEQGWGSYNYLAITMNSLRTTIGDRLTAELGLTLGFNSLDGD